MLVETSVGTILAFIVQWDYIAGEDIPVKWQWRRPIRDQEPVVYGETRLVDGVFHTEIYPFEPFTSGSVKEVKKAVKQKVESL